MKKIAFGLLTGVMLTTLTFSPAVSASGDNRSHHGIGNIMKYEVSKHKNCSTLRYLSEIAGQVEILRDIPYSQPKDNAGPYDNLLDIYQAKVDKEKNRMAIILLHGGGFWEGDKDEFSDLAARLAKRGFVVLSMNYRLKDQPDANWNKTLADGAIDVKDAVEWLKENSEKYGVDKNHIAIGGGSAGAAITLEAAYGNSTGVEGSGAFALLDLYGPSMFIKDNGNFNQSSIPAIMVHGVQDPVVSVGDSEEIAKKLKDAGVYHEFLPLENSGHGIIDEYMDDAILNISGFLYKVSNAVTDSAYKIEKDDISVVSGESFKVKLTRQEGAEYLKGNIQVTMPKGWKIQKDNVSKQDGQESVELDIKLPAGCKKGNHLIAVSYRLTNNKINQSIAIVKVKEPLAVFIRPGYNSSTSKVEIPMIASNPSKS